MCGTADTKNVRTIDGVGTEIILLILMLHLLPAAPSSRKHLLQYKSSGFTKKERCFGIGNIVGRRENYMIVLSQDELLSWLLSTVCHSYDLLSLNGTP